MDFTSKGTINTAELTFDLAMEIYKGIKTFGNADLAFKNQKNSAWDNENILIVDKEADRIVAELKKYKSGTVLISPEEYHIDEKTGEKIIDSKAIYYEYTTDDDLINQVNSDLLDVGTVLKDI